MASTPASDALHRQRILTGIRLILALALVAIIAGCLVFSWLTRDAMAALPFLQQQAEKRGALAQNAPVDVSTWQTAQALAPLAVTAEEAEYARDAERLADHEVDQAFASALREAAATQHRPTGAALVLSQKVAHLQQLVKEDQAAVQKLTSAPSSKSGTPGATGPDDLAIAKAQLGLDSDELADAQRDFARAIGDQRGAIQQQLAAHEASMRAYDAQARSPQPVALTSAQHERTLATRLNAWFAQRARYRLIQQALHKAQSDATSLLARHDQLESQASIGASVSAATAPTATGNASGAAPADKAAEFSAITNRTARRELLNIYDDRIQTLQALASVYSKWSAQVLLQHRIVLHLLLQSLALIAFILLCVLIVNGVVRHFVRRPGIDRGTLYTRTTLITLGAQLIGIVLILLIIFGTPRQMPTILGLTTAGLTVVLQDFILAFFGWFVLMGKNGIRVGDWVEINGVGGEVVEVGLLRTTLLETGNWTDKGHPTGRRVTVINSFAVKGQYFNFSTKGQWMWDELTFSIPDAGNVYGLIELIYQAVVKETEEEAHEAEEEWKHVTRKHGLSRFSADPAVSLRPGAFGIEIVVRYVTRAAARFEVRNRLYQRVIGLLQTPAPGLSEPETSIPV